MANLLPMRPNIKTTDYIVKGVHVERAFPPESTPHPAPIIFVHGGCHGSWVWENYLPYFARAGWDCHALNWFGHGQSAPHGDLIRRTITDVAEEISLVAEQFKTPPVIVGHSMGSLASQKFAEMHDVSALVLIAPVVPREVGGEVIELPLDFEQVWSPPPFEIACNLWFQNLSEQDARRYYEKLCPESPMAVHEATRWTASIDRTMISNPALVVSGEIDILTPASTGRALAQFYGADYKYLRGQGHSVLLAPQWRETAQFVEGWLRRRVDFGETRDAELVSSDVR
jgi:pimeloyl-ACP methyl ester carboxylesterase